MQRRQNLFWFFFNTLCLEADPFVLIKGNIRESEGLRHPGEAQSRATALRGAS